MPAPNEDHDRLIRLEAKVDGVASDILELRDLMRQLVTQQEFGPVKTIVFGMCGAVLVAVLSTVFSAIGLKSKA